MLTNPTDKPSFNVFHSIINQNEIFAVKKGVNIQSLNKGFSTPYCSIFHDYAENIIFKLSTKRIVESTHPAVPKPTSKLSVNFVDAHTLPVKIKRIFYGTFPGISGEKLFNKCNLGM